MSQATKDAIRHLQEQGYAVIAPTGDCKVISQEDSEYGLYWGATGGYLTIWRLPRDLAYNPGVEDNFGECFGNKWCLGEEWGDLTSVHFTTITQKMIDKENFEDYEDSDSEEEEDEEDDDKMTCEKCAREEKAGEEFKEYGGDYMCSECITEMEDSCDCCVKGWSKANEFGRCTCRCSACKNLLRDCQYGCSEEAKPETVHEMAVRIIAEQVKKQEEGGEAAAEPNEDEDCCAICCKCEEKFENSLNSPMCDECYEKLGDDKESRLRKYSQEVHGMEGAVYDAFRAVVFK